MTELKANRHYKDRVFCMIFNSREKLLEFYNAMGCCFSSRSMPRWISPSLKQHTA